MNSLGIEIQYNEKSQVCVLHCSKMYPGTLAPHLQHAFSLQGNKRQSWDSLLLLAVQKIAREYPGDQITLVQHNGTHVYRMELFSKWIKKNAAALAALPKM